MKTCVVRVSMRWTNGHEEADDWADGSIYEPG